MAYVTIDGFECRNTSTWGIYLHQYSAPGQGQAGMPGIVVKNVYIHNTGPGAFQNASQGPVSASNNACTNLPSAGPGGCDDGNYRNQLMFLDECNDPAVCTHDGTQFISDKVTNCGGHNCYQIQNDFGGSLIQNSYCSGWIHNCFDEKTVQGALLLSNTCDGTQLSQSGWIGSSNSGACFYTEDDKPIDEDITFQNNIVGPANAATRTTAFLIAAGCAGCGAVGTVTSKLYNNQVMLSANTASVAVATGQNCKSSPNQNLVIDARTNVFSVPRGVLQWWPGCPNWSISNWDYNRDGDVTGTPQIQYGTGPTTYTTLASWQAAGFGSCDSWGASKPCAPQAAPPVRSRRFP
jgi:hypothetical protein